MKLGLATCLAFVRRALRYTLLPAVLGCAASCGNDNILVFDGGDAAPDALLCGPVDSSTYVPSWMSPPNPAHQNACSPTQIADYAACNGLQDTSSCNQFMSDTPPAGVAPAACGQCIETNTTNATWGVVVFDESMMVGNVNIGGCVDDALGQTVTDAGPATCGQLLFESYGCQYAECGGCGGDEYNMCDILAVGGACKSYDAMVESASGACSALTADVITGDVTACFPDPTCCGPGRYPCPQTCGMGTPTSEQVEADWLTRIITFMCEKQ